ncbi:hypothetical protein ACFTAO_29205 [Paenibacillus rhizoplanae]
MKEYNRTLDISALDGLDCSCRQQWEAELREEPPTFESRLAVLEDEWKAAD